MFARAEVSFKNIPGALIVNAKALLEENGNSYVFKIVESTVKKVAVEITYREESTVAVSSEELQPGDQIVIEGVNQLQSDEQVRIL
jgi:multidrug efflux pump subunit AcrA (membrane-fusion protein)